MKTLPSQPILSQLQRFSDSFSIALIPLLHGLLRRQLLRRGAWMEEHRLQGIRCNLYRYGGGTGDTSPDAPPRMPVVLLHGIADNALTWAFVMRSLAAVGPVYALDLPGFGLSSFPAERRYTKISEQVAVVQQLLREVVGEPALLVGNSMGGWTATRLAQLTPDLVRGLVLVDPGGAQLDGRASWEPFMETVRLPNRRAIHTVYRQMYGRVPPFLYLGTLGFRSLFQRDPVTQFIAAADEADFFSAAELQALTVPCGLIWGERDRFLPGGSFEFFRDNLPDPMLLAIANCGHMPQQEQPRAVIRFVRDFARHVREVRSEKWEVRSEKWEVMSDE